MPYPVCFMNYPQQHMSPYYYPAMTQPGGYYVPSAPPSYRPIQVPVTNQYIAPNQPSYRELNNKEPPAYCTFVASDSASLPAHFTDTTESPKNQFRDDMIHKIEENTVHFNIPSQFDVIYATYPNQMFTNNHSMRLHHCDVGKLPCFGTNQCILKSKWCDSKVDCLDGSDESACSCKARLDSSRICDGYMDCPMGSDELGCFGCDKFQYSCYDNLKEFEDNRKSSTMMCYSAIEKCDGVFNCRNGKDESECSMIVNHVGGMLSYAVSHYEGILHRNHKGRWYPVYGNFHCGGSIYDEDWIITAAHCTKFFENHFYEVQAGILRRSSYSPAAQIIKVSHVITHAEYDRGTMKNDIALMRMKHPLSFNRWVRPICLPTKERVLDNRNWKFGPPAGTLCSAIGWGAIREKGPDPDDLKVVDVPIISKCKHVVDEETQSVCAGETFGTRDACQGDSGGPFVCKSLNNPFEWYLTGIVSHGEGCARAHEPGVYTRVSLYLDWIKENTIREPPSSSDFLFAPTRIPRQECPGFVCVWGGNKCIPTSQRCDGFVDCLGGEDEIECTINLLDLLLGSNMNSSNSINPNEITEHVDETGTKSISKKDLRNELFRCTKYVIIVLFILKCIVHLLFRNPQVINMDHRCDRIFDCEDGTDEENCTCRDYLKLSYPHLICDGTVDCKDESDEIGCLTCNETEFACRRSGMCIKKNLVCNGEVDCKYKEDETECLTLTNGHSVLLDLNGKPAMHSKGIVTKNVQSKWEVLCDHNDSFIINSDQIANDTCHLIGFTSGKLSKVVLLNSNAIESKYLNEKIKIDITSNPILRSNHTISKMNETCNALEIECESFHLNSLDPHSADHILIKKNKTSLHQNVYNFIPIDASDQTKLIVDPKEASDYELNDLHSFDWPWLAEIFIDGDLKANGILIKDSWILVDRNILGDSNELLQSHFIVALLGNTKSKLNIQSPYEQIMNVDCLQFVSNSNVMLFHLETPVDYNRYVLPSILPTHFELETESKCLAIALDSHQMTKAIELEIINDCKNSTNNVCYKQTAEVKAMNCDEEMSHRTSIIVCKTKNSSWYPNAFHQLKKGFCDFRYLVSVNNLNTKQSLKDIHQLIDHPCQKCQDHKLLPPKCEIHRCPLGKCLEKYQLCDLKSDCHDGSDENHEICFKLPTDEKPCNTSQFRCGDGKCVEKTKFCDQIPDCRDKSDEPSECTCFSYLKATSPSKICDGIRHCWDKTDEDSTYCGVNCPEKTSFNCLGSSFCVPNEMVCDKRADCPNGADEQFCNGIFQRDKKDSFGEVMERTYGIWHTKCFPKATPPSQQELEDLCKKLGFKNHPDAMARVINENNTNFASSYNNSTVDNIEVTFKNFTATKIIAYTKFSPVQLNDKFTVHLRPSKPLAKLVSWDSGDHQKCHRMEIKCIEATVCRNHCQLHPLAKAGPARNLLSICILSPKSSFSHWRMNSVRILPSLRVFQQSTRYLSTSKVYFADQRCRVLVVGGGTGGCSVAAKLSFHYGAGNVIVLDSADKHYYQPLFTLVGGGMKSVEDAAHPMAEVLPTLAQWVKDKADKFDPKNNSVTTKSGDVIKYDYMVVATGLQLNYEKIPGLVEALAIPKGAVCSTYSPKYVNRVYEALENFKSGNAIFTFPNSPVKCPGAPQKICYIAEHYLRKTKKRKNATVIYNTSLPVIFGVKHYADALWKVVEKRGINVNLRTNLVEVLPGGRSAVFENLDTQEKTTIDFNLLHVVPPMSTPYELKNNSDNLVNEAGFVDVNQWTLQHVRYPNVFALGDCSSSPNSKTAAAAAAQCQVVYKNLSEIMNGRRPIQNYDGYASCPLVTGYNTCILAEFDYNLQPLESFPILDQSKERFSMFYMKKNLMPMLYWQFMLNGIWNGPAFIRKGLNALKNL
ncbi:CLUMA_CG006281, isoform A [Clunio marinus]|uniref:Sulfide:quinone oxidoreductase, mitochondrial n=1 Tax=Clunio marinus TaxID=568069 RepID=A0A1J1HXX7_9DIPT|nr:CLUMA_CG006281, isoform A [Clunio marinus]